MPDKGEKDTRSRIDWKIDYPLDLVGNPKFSVKIKTTPAEIILDAIEALIKNPWGCFE